MTNTHARNIWPYVSSQHSHFLQPFNNSPPPAHPFLCCETPRITLTTNNTGRGDCPRHQVRRATSRRSQQELDAGPQPPPPLDGRHRYMSLHRQSRCMRHERVGSFLNLWPAYCRFFYGYPSNKYLLGRRHCVRRGELSPAVPPPPPGHVCSTYVMPEGSRLRTFWMGQHEAWRHHARKSRPFSMLRQQQQQSKINPLVSHARTHTLSLC